LNDGLCLAAAEMYVVFIRRDRGGHWRKCGGVDQEVVVACIRLVRASRRHTATL
jgi:hypothetical protein